MSDRTYWLCNYHNEWFVECNGCKECKAKSKGVINIPMTHPTPETNLQDLVKKDKDQQFITKDSGDRQQFESGMVRDTQAGKSRYDLAMDGPLFWALFDTTPLHEKADLVQEFRLWYESDGNIHQASSVIRTMASYEGGLFRVIDRYAALMTRGAVKYSERNWMKADGEAEITRGKSSACRHLVQYLRGDNDEDHMAAVVFNMNLVEYVRNRHIENPSKFPF